MFFVQAPQLRLAKAIWILVLALLFCLMTGCEITDRTISENFMKNRATFDRMVELGLSKDLSCYEAPGSVTQCTDPVAIKPFEEMRNSIGVTSIRATQNIPQLGNAVCFTMASYGVLVTDSYSKGLVYSTQALQPLVDDTSDHPELRFRFHRIADHWYVFTMP